MTGSANEKKLNIKKNSVFTNKSFYISTYGCQMNENDSEKLSGMLTQMGFCENNDMKESDLVIFNTCCVRESAEEKVFGHLGLLKGIKKQKPDMKIAVCGCMMQQEKRVEEIKKKYQHVDLVFGTHNIHELPEFIKKIFNHEKRIIAVKEFSDSITEKIPMKRKDKIKAWVKVMHGCNNYCSYCIVPYVRGREKSRDINEVVSEVKSLAEKGYKEITLLGQNVNSYGRDLDKNLKFSDLLSKVNTISGIERIRFMTSHPKDLSDDLIYAVKNLNKACEHIHLPLQSGSTNVLKSMNRHYTKQEFTDLAKKIQDTIPDVSLTTDIIVGFPGETDEDFEDTLDVLNKVRFDFAYMFIYSKRPGTPASSFIDQIPEDIKKERFNRLLNLQNKISKEKNDRFCGLELEVLVEGASKNNENVFAGRTRTNKIVNFYSDKNNLSGKLVGVKIEIAKTWSLFGHLV